jgi:RND family efflux transporter MFP subunit
MNMSKKLTAALLTALTLSSLSCGNNDHRELDNKSAVRAKTEMVQFSSISDEFQAPGTIRARTRTILSSKVVGQILSVTVHQGDRVHTGQQLAEIENRESLFQLRRAQAMVTEAQAALEEARRGVQAAEAAVSAAGIAGDLALATRKRYDVLQERHSVTPQEYEEVQAKYKAAVLEVERGQQMLAAAESRCMQVYARIEQSEAEVAAAEVTHGYSRIIAPIDGIVTQRDTEPGMLAVPGMPLLAIDDDRTYELEVSVGESRAGNIVLGQNVRVEVDAFDGTIIHGWVREIGSVSDPVTRTYVVKLQLTTPEHGVRKFRSGLFGRAFFPTHGRQTLVIPESAVIRHGQLEGVYAVANDIASFRLVKTGKTYGEDIEVLSGLASGTRILTAPSIDITDGVKIVDDQSSRKTP